MPLLRAGQTHNLLGGLSVIGAVSFAISAIIVLDGICIALQDCWAVVACLPRLPYLRCARSLLRSMWSGLYSIQSSTSSDEKSLSVYSSSLRVLVSRGTVNIWQVCCEYVPAVARSAVYWAGQTLRWLGIYVIQPEYHAMAYILRAAVPLADLCSTQRGPQLNRDEQCSHCWEDMNQEANVLTHDACKNSWHPSCLQAWVNFRQSDDFVACPFCTGSLASSGAVVRPDGQSGHGWRPSVMELSIQRLFAYASAWMLLRFMRDVAAIVFVRETFETGSYRTSIAAFRRVLMVNPISLRLASWLSCTGQLQIHWLIVRTMRSNRHELRDAVWLASSCFMFRSLAARVTFDEGGTTVNTGLLLALNGVIASMTLLIQTKALILNRAQDEGIGLH